MLLRPDSSFALLAHFLSPCKDDDMIGALRTLIQHGGVEWGPLLYMANLQLCTPLWYVRLKQDGLLTELPEELQEYLAHLHQANVERNGEMRAGLEELLGAMTREGIEAVLLKGCATFCDDLYGDPGARVMGDLDILVRPEQVERSRQIMVALGYQEVPNPGREPDGLATDDRHHHINCHVKPGTPVAVEIHYKVAYSQAGRVCPADVVWHRRVSAKIGKVSTNIPSPYDRLLHNAVHALVAEGDFIRSRVSLRQLAEFAALVMRYGGTIDWSRWENDGRREGVKTELAVYRALSWELMGGSTPERGQYPLRVKWHMKRIIGAGELVDTGSRQVRRSFRWALKGYYFLKLPFWAWDNVFYARGAASQYDRILCILKKLSNARGREKRRGTGTF